MRILIVLIASLSLTACIELIGERGNGIRVEEVVTVEAFDAIEVSGVFTVKLSQDNSNKVVVETDENLLDYIEIGVYGNTLEINTDRRLDSDEGIIISVPVNKLKELNLSGASDISSTNPIETDDLEINVSGAGKMELMLDATEVSLDVSGATIVYLEGAAETLEIDMSGAGSLEASELEVKDCIAQISGVGKILVNVSGTLDADVSGLGSVEYVGDPKSVKGDVSGVGNVSRK